MARKRRGGHQPQMKGFRPGKEPAHFKKQRAKAQLGSDATWAQKQAVEAVAGRSPEEVQKMVGRWSLGLGGGGLLLGIGGLFAYGWSVPVGVAIHLVAAVLLFLAYRVRSQSAGLAELADSMR